MKTQANGDVLMVMELERLDGVNSNFVKEIVKTRLREDQRIVEIDCAKVKSIDSEGLGALVSINKLVAPRNGLVRLNKVQPLIRGFLELVKFHQFLEIND